jgi:hypothetical protein
MTVVEYLMALGLVVAILGPVIYFSLKLGYWFADRHERAYFRAMFRRAENHLKMHK